MNCEAYFWQILLEIALVSKKYYDPSGYRYNLCLFAETCRYNHFTSDGAFLAFHVDNTLLFFCLHKLSFMYKLYKCSYLMDFVQKVSNIDKISLSQLHDSISICFYAINWVKEIHDIEFVIFVYHFRLQTQCIYTTQYEKVELSVPELHTIWIMGAEFNNLVSEKMLYNCKSVVLT